MAFTGVAVIKQISERTVRITGLSLVAGDEGILGLFGGSVVGAVALPESFQPRPRTFGGVAVTLIESVKVTLNPVTDVSNFGIPIRVVKTGAGLAFSISFINDAAAVASADLEIYVEFEN